MRVGFKNMKIRGFALKPTALLRSGVRGASLACALALLAGCAESVARNPSPNEAVAAVGLRPAPPPLPAPIANIPEWTSYFEDIAQGAILIDIEDRWLIYWEPGGGSYHAFPIAVPLNADLEKTGLTRVVRKRENPDWRPTPSMIERNPDLPRYIGPGPQNPLGEHALYLGWTYYAIHGTNNPDAIGTRATSGCFRLKPKDIAWLFDRVAPGVPVRVMRDVPT